MVVAVEEIERRAKTEGRRNRRNRRRRRGWEVGCSGVR